MNEFARKVRHQINTIYSRDFNLQPQDIADEDELFFNELAELLSQWEQNDAEINNEKLFEPFNQLLSDRYHRVVLTHLNDSAQPTTKAQLASTLLAKEIILTLNKISYKPRSIDALLKTELNWSIGRLAGVYLRRIDRMLSHASWYDDIITDLKPYQSLLNLKKTLLVLQNETACFTIENIQPLLKVFEAHSHENEDLESDCLSKSKMLVNQIYKDLAENIMMILKANHGEVLGLSVDQMLRPSPSVNNRLQSATNVVAPRKLFLNILKEINPSLWDDFLNRVKISSLIHLVTDGQHTEFGDLLKWKGDYQSSQIENKVLVYTLLHIYATLRSQLAHHTSYLGALLSYVVKVPDRDNKLTAINDVKQLLKSNDSLSEIVKTIYDENVDSYKIQRVSLNDGNLKKIMAHLITAANISELNVDQTIELEEGHSLRV